MKKKTKYTGLAAANLPKINHMIDVFNGKRKLKGELQMSSFMFFNSVKQPATGSPMEDAFKCEAAGCAAGQVCFEFEKRVPAFEDVEERALKQLGLAAPPVVGAYRDSNGRTLNIHLFDAFLGALRFPRDPIVCEQIQRAEALRRFQLLKEMVLDERRSQRQERSK